MLRILAFGSEIKVGLGVHSLNPQTPGGGGFGLSGW